MNLLLVLFKLHKVGVFDFLVGNAIFNNFSMHSCEKVKPIL